MNTPEYLQAQRDHERAVLDSCKPGGASRTLSAIADDIGACCPRPYFGAVPYLQAMGQLSSIADRYGCDDARSIVLYFLSNARTWRGPDAVRLKAELKHIAGVK